MARMPYSSRDLTRIVLSVGAIGVLIVSTAWIVRPFVSAFLWATMIVISTWPLLIGLQTRLWGKRGLAVTVMTVALLLVLIVPLGFMVGALVNNIDNIVARVSSLDKVGMPAPPAWLGSIPLAGPKLLAGWERLAAEGPGGLTARATPYAGRFIQWVAAQIGSVGGMILHFLLTVIISAVLYANGGAAARGVRKFVSRLAGASGDRAVLLAAASIRGVAFGVVVTAIIQTLIAGTGLFILSVPGAPLITAAIFILCLAQIGPLLIMLPAVIWKFYAGPTVSASVLLAFMLVACTIDNVIRPILIRKGADLPLMLVFSGVIGGMISFGIMGVFVGPVILAVTYNLLQEWVEYQPEAEDVVAAGEGVKQAAPAG